MTNLMNYINIDAKNTAKLARLKLKKLFPGVKFSVRSQSGYLSISWDNGPRSSQVDEAILCFKSKTSSLSDDGIDYINGYWTKELNDLATSGKLSIESLVCNMYGNSSEPAPVLTVGSRVSFSGGFTSTCRDVTDDLIRLTASRVAQLLGVNLADFDPNNDYRYIGSGNIPHFIPSNMLTSEENYSRPHTHALSHFDSSFYECVVGFARVHSEQEIRAFAVPAVASEIATTEIAALPETAAAPGLSVLSIVENEAKNGFELYFKPKSVKSVRRFVGDNGFYWMGKKECWVAKRSDKSRAVIAELQSMTLEAETTTRKGNATETPGTLTIIDRPRMERLAAVASAVAATETTTIKTTTTTTTTTNLKTAEKFEDMANGLQSQIDDKFRRRPTHTRRMQNTASSMVSDGLRLQEIQTALRVFATAMRSGILPESLAGVRSKKAVVDIIANIRSIKYYENASYYKSGSSNPALERMAGADRILVDEYKLLAEAVAATETATTTNAATEVLNRIERSKIANSGIPGFFPTPDPLADYVVEMISIQSGHKVLDLSAGYGSLLTAASRLGCPPEKLYANEINYSLAQMLKADPQIGHVAQGDITDSDHIQMLVELWGQFDKIILNPAFERGHAAVEFKIAYEHFLRPGGAIVGIMPSSVENGDRYSQFRDWLGTTQNSTIQRLPERSFTGVESARQTSVNTCACIAFKPAATVQAVTVAAPTVQAVAAPAVAVQAVAAPTVAADQLSLFDASLVNLLLIA